MSKNSKTKIKINNFLTDDKGYVKRDIDELNFNKSKSKKRIVRNGKVYDSIEEYEKDVKITKTKSRNERITKSGEKIITNSKNKTTTKSKNLFKVTPKSNNSSLINSNQENVNPNVDKTGNLCKSCGKQDCYNRKPYKTHCAQFSKVKLDTFKDFHHNHGYTGSGSHRPIVYKPLYD